jgi:hypothetical protein
MSSLHDVSTDYLVASLGHLFLHYFLLLGLHNVYCSKLVPLLHTLQIVDVCLVLVQYYFLIHDQLFVNILCRFVLLALLLFIHLLSVVLSHLESLLVSALLLSLVLLFPLDCVLESHHIPDIYCIGLRKVGVTLLDSSLEENFQVRLMVLLLIFC